MSVYEHEFSAMGSTFRIRLDDISHVKGRAGEVESLFTTLAADTERLEQCMSRFRSDSELTLLNRQIGNPVVISRTLADVLSLAETMREWTNGAFDPRILTVLEEIGYPGAPVTGRSSEGSLSSNPLYREIGRLTQGAIVEIDEPMDLGGIGKGYAVDAIAEVIARFTSTHPLTGYLIDAGGDIVIGGCQHNGDPWNIGVEDPEGQFPLAAALTIPLSASERVAVCTSSVRRKAWVKSGRTVHHLIDPALGASAPTQLLAVTAVAARAALAEVVTKYVFLRGAMNGPLWEHSPAVYLTIAKGQVVSFTSAMQQYISWLHEQMVISELPR
ncbi:FAD:protein FMN transferase [Alicyclobacillus sp. ALC3]|uniref:FAD:protein FMN transferase n=1 Tax=Alicyclobacillus sp. ALC3 TaxID=2796143 RepID=UPI0023789E1A|nr:FAD:protein FMN transferase [Alicyclobacillus sp. ALC3]WDL97248.1 FAD:protein FMN transferase [Alicyclobacillus sp. ALC3]